MKRKLLFLGIVFVCVQFAQAQTYILYGTTYGGGKYGNGTVFSYNLSTSKESIVIDFDSLNGIGPLGNLTEDTASNLLYGVTNAGGDSNKGVLFSYNIISGKDSTINSFKATQGIWPGQGNLTLYNGNLYGMTSAGGKYNFGTVFTYNRLTGMDSTVINFDTGSGKEYGPLGINLAVFSGNGLMYGMTYSGGKNGMGAIFSFNASTGKDSVVANLNNVNGAQPEEGTLVLDNELFYGVTGAGGLYSNGVLFSFDPVTGKDSALINFKVSNGSNPYGALLFDTLDGLLYGMTSAGGIYDLGVLYSFNPVSGKETVLFNYNDTLGSSPTGNLILGPGGILYGTTNQDQNGNGLIFSYDPVAATYNIVFAFNYIDGSGPYGSLTLAKAPVITGISPASASISTSVYPNPCNGVFQLRINNYEIGIKSTIEVYNMLGEKVLSPFSIQNSPFSIDLGNQPSGIYFLRVYDAQHQYISTEKIVVQ